MEHTPRSSLPLILCVAAGIGALCAAQLGQSNPIAVTDGLPFYTQSAALVVALVACHVWPRRSWAWLTAAGSVCAIPILLLLLRDADLPHDEWWYEAITSVARPLLLVGLLGAATLVWRAGHRRAGAVLMGATLTAPLVSTLAVASVALADPTVALVVGLVFVALTVVFAVRAWNVPVSTEPATPPGWSVTVAGAVAWVAIGVDQWWPAPDQAQVNATAELFDQLRTHYLSIGSMLLMIGVCVALFAGAQVLITGLAGGLLLGSMVPVVSSAWVEIRVLEPPSYLPLVVALVALAAGVLLARARATAMVGAGVLGALVLGLLAAYLMTDGPSAADNNMASDLTPYAAIALAFVVVAAVPVHASLGSVLAPSGAAPAVLVGVVSAIGFGVSLIATNAVTSSPATYGTVSGYPALMVGLAAAAVLTVVAARRS